MQYVNFVYGDDDDAVMHTAPLAEGEAAYLERIIGQFQPLSEEDYMDGPAVVLHTMARYSYVLKEEDLLWCVEWNPGLIVVRFSATGQMAWAAIRSPVPNFGGREASDADWGDYDEHADNPQYNLVFHPWDAQFDEQYRVWRSFVPADSSVQTRFEQALSRVNELGDIMERRFSDAREAWVERCKRNLEAWCGDGIRLK